MYVALWLVRAWFNVHGAKYVNCQSRSVLTAPDASEPLLLAGGQRFSPALPTHSKGIWKANLNCNSTSTNLAKKKQFCPIRVLMIDNYDSFTYNLVQYFRELGATVDVYRNDVHGAQVLLATQPSHIVLSPGPGAPQRSGVCLELCDIALRQTAPPLLGVCLGHQCICWSAGTSVRRAKRLMHGKSSLIHHSGSKIFENIPSPFSAGRYHSLIVESQSLVSVPGLQVTAQTELGEVMAVEHDSRAIFGVQFHPESILTEMGHQLLSNFLAC